MFSRCHFCHHVNPPGAKYCNECGASLGLTPRQRCDTVDDLDVRQCHPSAGELPQLSPGVTTEPTTAVERLQLGSSIARAVEAVKAASTANTGVVLAPPAARPALSAGRFAVLATAFTLAIFGAILYAIQQNRLASADAAASASATAGKISVAEKEARATEPALVATRVTDNSRTDLESMSRGAGTESPPSTGQSAADDKAVTIQARTATAPTAMNVPDANERARQSSEAVERQHLGAAALARDAMPMTPAATSASSPPRHHQAPGDCTPGIAALGLCDTNTVAAHRQ